MRSGRSIAALIATLVAAGGAAGAELRVGEVKAQCGAVARATFDMSAAGPVANLQFDIAVDGAELVAIHPAPATSKWVVNRIGSSGRTTVRMRGGPVESRAVLGQIVVRVGPGATGPVGIRLSEIRAFGDGFGEVAPDVTASIAVDCASPPLVFRHLAGSPGGPGARDGVAGHALMNDTRSIVIDGDGNLFAADSGNHAIRRVDARGETMTLAGRSGVPGAADGRGSGALLQSPRGIALAADGSLVVADTGTQTIRRVTRSGEVTTIAGKAGEFGSVDGTGSAARFCFPAAVAVARDGSIVVADTGFLDLTIYGTELCGQAIRRIAPDGTVTTVAGKAGAIGVEDGAPDVARFYYPQGIAVARDGAIWVADTGWPHGRSYMGRSIRRIAPDGMVTTLAGRGDRPYSGGSIDGTGSEARFSYPTQLVEEASGSFLVADAGSIRRVTAGGVVTTVAGAPGAAHGVAIGADGAVHSSDRNGAIWKLDPEREPALVAGSRIQSIHPFDDKDAGRFRSPVDVAVARDGTLVVADYDRIVRVTREGSMSIVVPGGGPLARLSAIAVDGDGTIWATDIDKSCVWRVRPDGALLQIGGANGWFGWADGGPGEAMFFWPRGIAVAPDDAVWVADTNNHVLRRVTKEGVVTTVAGTRGANETLDGPVAMARFNHPVGIAFGPGGEAWVTESYGQSVRRLAEGQVVTIAGSPGIAGNADGSGANARFASLAGVAVDARGRAWVADGAMLRIVESDGSVSTAVPSAVAGSIEGISFAAVDDGLAADARFAGVAGLEFDEGGRLFVADPGAYAIKVGEPCFEGARCGEVRRRPAGRD